MLFSLAIAIDPRILEKICKVAVVQMKSSERKVENLSTSIEYISRAAASKANTICFPEFLMSFSPAEQDVEILAKTAETVKGGKFVSELRRAARINNIQVIATIYEKPDNIAEHRVHDTAVIIDRRGKISSIYRKLHLYDALGFKESAKFVAGDKINRPTRLGSASMGIMICYDIRFPEMSRILAGNGANMFIVPSAWVHGIMKEEHWQTMLKARAIENGSFVIAPDQLGNIYSGRSMIIDPFGIVLLDMGNREGMEIIEIDISRIKEVRASLPLLENRRTDVYRKDIDIFS